MLAALILRSDSSRGGTVVNNGVHATFGFNVKYKRNGYHKANCSTSNAARPAR